MTARRRRQREIDRPIVDLATHPTAAITVKVLADYCQCDRRTVLRMIECGSLEAYRFGRREWRIVTDSARRAFRAVPRETA